MKFIKNCVNHKTRKFKLFFQALKIFFKLFYISASGFNFPILFYFYFLNCDLESKMTNK